MTFEQVMTQLADSLDGWAENGTRLMGYFMAHDQAAMDYANACRTFIEALLADPEIGQVVGLRMNAELRSFNAAVDTFNARLGDARATYRPDSVRADDPMRMQSLAQAVRGDIARAKAATAAATEAAEPT